MNNKIHVKNHSEQPDDDKAFPSIALQYGKENRK